MRDQIRNKSFRIHRLIIFFLLLKDSCSGPFTRESEGTTAPSARIAANSSRSAALSSRTCARRTTGNRKWSAGTSPTTGSRGSLWTPVWYLRHIQNLWAKRNYLWWPNRAVSNKYGRYSWKKNNTNTVFLLYDVYWCTIVWSWPVI